MVSVTVCCTTGGTRGITRDRCVVGGCVCVVGECVCGGRVCVWWEGVCGGRVCVYSVCVCV